MHGENGLDDQAGGDAGERAVIGHPIEDSGGELKDLFRIVDQASENGLTPFAPVSASIPNQKVLRSAVPSLVGCEPLPGYVLPTAGAQIAGAVFHLCGELGKDKHEVPHGRSDNPAFHSARSARKGCRGGNEPRERSVPNGSGVAARDRRVPSAARGPPSLIYYSI